MGSGSDSDKVTLCSITPKIETLVVQYKEKKKKRVIKRKDNKVKKKKRQVTLIDINRKKTMLTQAITPRNNTYVQSMWYSYIKMMPHHCQFLGKERGNEIKE